MRCETLFVDVSDGVAIVTLKPPNKRNALWYGMTGRPFNGRGAAGIGFVNTAVPLEHLREATMSVAREIAQKDPWALKAANAYRDAFRKEGIGDFLAGKFKPGLESHGARKPE